MLVFESGDTLEEQSAQTIIEELLCCLRNNDVTVEAAKYLLDQTKKQVEKAKV